MFGSNNKKAMDIPMQENSMEARAFVISEKSVVNGNVTTNEPTTINGTVEGTLTVENNMVLGVNGVVRGPVYAHVATVEGSITGDLICKGSVRLAATAKVTGDVQCTSLLIAEGAYFCGKVVCTQAKE